MKPVVTSSRRSRGGLSLGFVGGIRLVPEKRTIRVLMALVVGMTLISSLLRALEPKPGHRGAGMVLSALDPSARQRLFDTAEPQDWQYIIIHDSRGQVGGEDELNAAWDDWYRSQGLPRNGAGYHFVINDDQGSEDGGIQRARRWENQLVGGFIDAEDANFWNRVSIGVCVMGDATEQPYSKSQMDSLVWLIKQLQEQYGIPRERVIVQVGDSGSVASAFFPEGQFRRQLLD